MTGIDYESVRRFWNDRAARQGEMDDRSLTFFCRDPRALDFRDRREKELFDERADLDGAEKLLEAGCGSGRWTAFLARRVRSVVAFDFASDLLAVNRQTLEEQGVANVTFVRGDIHSLALDDSDFDAAVCFGVALYIRDEDLAPAYRNLRVHLRPGAVLYTKEPLAAETRQEQVDAWNEALGASYSCLYRLRDEHEAAVAGAGFERLWSVSVYEPGEPLAPSREGVDTWFAAWKAV